MAKKERLIFAPCSEKQRIVLQDKTTDVILVGGGAGGGKSRICLTKNLDGIHDPKFRCVILRRYEPELKRQGGLIDESKNIYSHFTKLPYKTQAKLWEFPSGATIGFSAISCDDDLGSWQGSQLTRACVDEAGDKWTEKQVLFLQSRLRTVGSDIHPQLILSCNPDPNSFLFEWVKFCLDEDTGVPKEGTENIIRWFCVEDNKAKWANSPEECYELYGKPKNLIYAHGLTEEQINAFSAEEKLRLFMPKSFRFVPTGVFDNPYLLPPKNNSYLASLLSQPHVNQLKFLHGSWTARELGSSYFDRKWVEMVDYPPANAMARVRAYDFAAEEKTATNNPDWTCGVKMSKDKFGKYYIEDVVRYRERTDKVLKNVVTTAISDGLGDCAVHIPTDPAAAGKTAVQYYLRVLAEHGVNARTKVSSGHNSKLSAFKPFCALAESGNLAVVKADWNDAFFQELESFSGEKSIQRTMKDDQVDSVSAAFACLARQTLLPVFSVPELTQKSPIPTI